MNTLLSITPSEAPSVYPHLQGQREWKISATGPARSMLLGGISRAVDARLFYDDDSGERKLRRGESIARMALRDLGDIETTVATLPEIGVVAICDAARDIEGKWAESPVDGVDLADIQAVISQLPIIE